LIQKFISKLSKQEKKFLYVTVGIVFIALFERLFVGPVTNSLKNLDVSIENQKVNIVRDLRMLSYEDQIFKNHESFSKYFMHEFKGDSDINAEFLRSIEKLATQSNIKLVKSNASESKKEEKYNEYYAKLDCTGLFRDIITFINAVNTSDDLLKVVSLDMTPKRGESNAMTAAMTIVKMVITPAEMKMAENPAL